MIKSGKVVNLKYLLKNAKGAVLDKSDSDKPFHYLHGSHQIVPGLESALVGLKTGDKKSVVVAPSEGYGEIDPRLKMIVNRSQFPSDITPEVGLQFQVNSPDRHSLVFTIEKVDGDQIHVDGNHPLAGETLYFEVEVMDIRDATQDEIHHGHAHGPDGHHHH